MLRLGENIKKFNNFGENRLKWFQSTINFIVSQFMHKKVIVELLTVYPMQSTKYIMSVCQSRFCNIWTPYLNTINTKLF